MGITAARLVASVMLAACNPAASSQKPAPEPVPTRARVARPLASGESNIARADYIGPEACGQCHGVQYAAWTRSLHRVMNAKASDPKAVIGVFDGKPLAYAGGEARFDKTLAGYAMTLRKGDRETRYHITRTIGHRALQEYVGIEEGRGPNAEPGDEVRLPFGYWPIAGGWNAQPSFDPWLDDASFDAYAPVREPWAERCPWCHSTYPFAQRIARASLKNVGHGFEQFFESAPGSERLTVADQVTTGISCESCHLGGRAHADGAAIDFLPHGAAPRGDAPTWPTTFAEQRKDARVVNGVCAQCHSGPSPRLADGTSLRNSSEALDLAASRCQAKCTDCHDPHLGSTDFMAANAACAKCHALQAQPAHAGPHHQPNALGIASTQATCIDCHMPKLVMGIDHFVHSHRISSPTNAKLLADGSPNACNLCHLDRTIEWTLTELRDHWDVRLAVARSAYGDNNVGDAWLASKSPAVRLIAIMTYAQSDLGPYARAQIENSLTDTHAYVRAWTKFALRLIDQRSKHEH